METKQKVCMLINGHVRTDGRVFQRMSVDLANAGYDVTIVCRDGLQDEIKSGVKIQSVKPLNKLIAKIPLIRSIVIRRRIFKVAKKLNADINHIHEPLLLPAVKLIKKSGKKVIYDAHEDSLSEILDIHRKSIFSRIKISVNYRRLKKLQNKYIPNCDAVISVTPHIVDKLKELNKNVCMITNYPNYDKEAPKYSFSKNVVFCGTILNIWALDNVIDSISMLDDNVKLLLAGHPNAYLEYLQNKSSFKQVEYFGRVDKNKVNELYAKSAIGVCCLKYSQNTGGKKGSLGVTKIYEMMGKGLPIICTDSEVWTQLIEEYKCGILVNPNNIHEIKEAIEKLLNNPEFAEEMGKNGRRAVEEKYNWATQREVLLKLYSSL